MRRSPLSLPVRKPTPRWSPAAKRCTIVQSRNIVGRTVDVEITRDKERAIVGDIDRIACRCRFRDPAVSKFDRQGAGGTAKNHRRDLVILGDVDADFFTPAGLGNPAPLPACPGTKICQPDLGFDGPGSAVIESCGSPLYGWYVTVPLSLQLRAAPPNATVFSIVGATNSQTSVTSCGTRKVIFRCRRLTR